MREKWKTTLHLTRHDLGLGEPIPLKPAGSKTAQIK